MFHGYKVIVINPVYEGVDLSVGRVAVLGKGASHYEKRKGSLILDLREGGGRRGT